MKTYYRSSMYINFYSLQKDSAFNKRSTLNNNVSKKELSPNSNRYQSTSHDTLDQNTTPLRGNILKRFYPRYFKFL